MINIKQNIQYYLYKVAIKIKTLPINLNDSGI